MNGPMISMNKTPLICAVVASLSLAGCMEGAGPSATAPATTSPPENYRQLALAYARQSFVDPFSVRDASISQPLQVGYGLTGSTMVWVTCIRANAKNRMGGYAGLQETVVAFSGDSLDLSRSGSAGGGLACREAVYSPFPELERLS